MKTYTATVSAYLASKNDRVRPARNHPGMFSTNQYKSSLEALCLYFRKAAAEQGWETWPGKFSARIEVWVSNRKDGHNTLTVIMDALQRAGVISNDRNMVYHGMASHPAPGGVETVQIKLKTLEASCTQ